MSITKSQLQSAIFLAFVSRYNHGFAVSNKTNLGNGGLGLDSMVIATDLHLTVLTVVHRLGWDISSKLTSGVVSGCGTVGDVVDKAWEALVG